MDSIDNSGKFFFLFLVADWPGWVCVISLISGNVSVICNRTSKTLGWGWETRREGWARHVDLPVCQGRRQPRDDGGQLQSSSTRQGQHKISTFVSQTRAELTRDTQQNIRKYFNLKNILNIFLRIIYRVVLIASSYLREKDSWSRQTNYFSEIFRNIQNCSALPLPPRHTAISLYLFHLTRTTLENF